ncbi:AEC family transporter [Hoeflea prorocentri]|uniref:Transporter n=1 Tax=Hoeflea prorocentri TaxID=1922333 RepID=A0A9X3ULQ8_9HYPH|nr:AEC family transporter [Hoeflea prorocentri]MCY6382929.1 transporter [Hoeflea prorocentri]MDA5400729.1 transporter [Hoeflea prorocentri]
MQELFLNLMNVIVPVLICAAMGYGLARFNAPFDSKTIRTIIINIGYPALIISHLSAGHIEFDRFLMMAVAAACSVAAFGVIGFVFLTLTGLPVRAFLSPMMLSNVGNIGLPIALLAFGAEGMAYAMGFVVVVVIGISTVGMWIPSGRFSLRDLAMSPIVWSVAIALGLLGSGTSLPKPINDTFTILGGLSIPLMLLTLGHTLASLRVATLWQAVYLSLFHVVMAAAVAFGLVHLFGFAGVERGVVIVACLMPVAASSYLFIEQHMPEIAHEVAGFIMVSTLLTILVLPLALTLWVN